MACPRYGSGTTKGRGEFQQFFYWLMLVEFGCFQFIDSISHFFKKDFILYDIIFIYIYIFPDGGIYHWSTINSRDRMGSSLFLVSWWKEQPSATWCYLNLVIWEFHFSIFLYLYLSMSMCLSIHSSVRASVRLPIHTQIQRPYRMLVEMFRRDNERVETAAGFPQIHSSGWTKIMSEER